LIVSSSITKLLHFLDAFNIAYYVFGTFESLIDICGKKGHFWVRGQILRLFIVSRG